MYIKKKGMNPKSRKKGKRSSTLNRRAEGGFANNIGPPEEYNIEYGDTLGGIAKRFGTTVEDLSRINKIDNPNLIYAGNKLRISDSQQGLEQPSREEVRPRSGISVGSLKYRQLSELGTQQGGSPRTTPKSKLKELPRANIPSVNVRDLSSNQQQSQGAVQQGVVQQQG